jgi:TfoX/Sxy family transcriptional regulator of competence genes
VTVACDETLATRVRAAFAERDGVVERRMFGGLAFMLNGHMTCGMVADRLMLRLGEEGAEAALLEDHVSPMDYTGRPMTTMVYVELAGIASACALAGWVARSVEFVETLPPKT